jgi:hypothetical protein
VAPPSTNLSWSALLIKPHTSNSVRRIVRIQQVRQACNFVICAQSWSDDPNKSKVINLDSDGDDDPQGPPSPNGSNVAVEISSPYGKARVYKPSKTTITAHIWQVCPPLTDSTKSTLELPIPLPLTGMCCLVRGTPSSEFQFFKGQHESDHQMIADSHVIDHKFDYALRGVVQKSQGGMGKWNQRVLLWVEEPTNTPFTKEQWIQVYIHWIIMCIKKVT